MEVEEYEKILLASIALAVVLLATGSASAHWRPHFGFGLYLSPPAAWVAPPPSYPGYYAPYGSYDPYYNGYRVWVPGHWERRWTPYGWTRVWLPGYWQYR